MLVKPQHPGPPILSEQDFQAWLREQDAKDKFAQKEAERSAARSAAGGSLEELHAQQVQSWRISERRLEQEAKQLSARGSVFGGVGMAEDHVAWSQQAELRDRVTREKVRKQNSAFVAKPNSTTSSGSASQSMMRFVGRYAFDSNVPFY